MRGILLAALVLATAPLYADYTPFYLGLLTEVLVFGLFALAYDVLLGHAGVLSLGHSAFLGVAAYVTGIVAHLLEVTNGPHTFDEIKAYFNSSSGADLIGTAPLDTRASGYTFDFDREGIAVIH